MPKVPLRVAIDTNIWISFLIGKTLVGLDEKIANDCRVEQIREGGASELVQELSNSYRTIYYRYASGKTNRLRDSTRHYFVQR